MPARLYQLLRAARLRLSDRDDLERIAEYVGMTARDFERRFVYRTRHLLRLRVPRDQQCHFLRDGGCSIHAVKPVQCRKFPFWPELVNSTARVEKNGGLVSGDREGRVGAD